jgi:hypothetical protein
MFVCARLPEISIMPDKCDLKATCKIPKMKNSALVVLIDAAKNFFLKKSSQLILSTRLLAMKPVEMGILSRFKSSSELEQLGWFKCYVSSLVKDSLK